MGSPDDSVFTFHSASRIWLCSTLMLVSAVCKSASVPLLVSEGAQWPPFGTCVPFPVPTVCQDLHSKSAAL